MPSPTPRAGVKSVNARLLLACVWLLAAGVLPRLNGQELPPAPREPWSLINPTAGWKLRVPAGYVAHNYPLPGEVHRLALYAFRDKGTEKPERPQFLVDARPASPPRRELAVAWIPLDPAWSPQNAEACQERVRAYAHAARLKFTDLKVTPERVSERAALRVAIDLEEAGRPATRYTALLVAANERLYEISMRSAKEQAERGEQDFTAAVSAFELRVPEAPKPLPENMPRIPVPQPPPPAPPAPVVQEPQGWRIAAWTGGSFVAGVLLYAAWQRLARKSERV